MDECASFSTTQLESIIHSKKWYTTHKKKMDWIMEYAKKQSEFQNKKILCAIASSRSLASAKANENIPFDVYEREGRKKPKRNSKKSKSNSRSNSNSKKTNSNSAKGSKQSNPPEKRRHVMYDINPFLMQDAIPKFNRHEHDQKKVEGDRPEPKKAEIPEPKKSKLEPKKENPEPKKSKVEIPEKKKIEKIEKNEKVEKLEKLETPEKVKPAVIPSMPANSPMYYQAPAMWTTPQLLNQSNGVIPRIIPSRIFATKNISSIEYQYALFSDEQKEEFKKEFLKLPKEQQEELQHLFIQKLGPGYKVEKIDLEKAKKEQQEKEEKEKEEKAKAEKEENVDPEKAKAKAEIVEIDKTIEHLQQAEKQEMESTEMMEKKTYYYNDKKTTDTPPMIILTPREVDTLKSNLFLEKTLKDRSTYMRNGFDIRVKCLHERAPGSIDFVYPKECGELYWEHVRKQLCTYANTHLGMDPIDLVRFVEHLTKLDLDQWHCNSMGLEYAPLMEWVQAWMLPKLAKDDYQESIVQGMSYYTDDYVGIATRFLLVQISGHSLESQMEEATKKYNFELVMVMKEWIRDYWGSLFPIFDYHPEIADRVEMVRSKNSMVIGAIKKQPNSTAQAIEMYKICKKKKIAFDDCEVYSIIFYRLVYQQNAVRVTLSIHPEFKGKQTLQFLLPLPAPKYDMFSYQVMALRKVSPLYIPYK